MRRLQEAEDVLVSVLTPAQLLQLFALLDAEDAPPEFAGPADALQGQ